MPNVHEIIPDTDARQHLATAHSRAVGVVRPPKEMTIQDFLRLLGRRRGLIAMVIMVVLFAAVIRCASTTRMYKASASIQVQKDSVDALSLNEMMGPNAQPPDAMETNLTLQTQAQILQSETLALRVIALLHLEQTSDFRPKFSAMGWLISLFSPATASDPPGAGLDESPGRRVHVVKVFESDLKVKPVSGTRLISIEYLSSDPKIAAAVVNSLIENLIDYNFETRQGATQKASGWLANQLSDLRQQSEDLQARVVSMQRDSGMFSDGQTDAQGRQQVYAPALDRLQQTSVRLGEAKSARILKGALYEAVRQGDPELISSLAGAGSLQGSTSGLAGSLSLLQNLRGQEAQTQAQLNELSAKFGPNYPKIEELQAGLAGTQRAIRDESARIAARAKNDYEASVRVEGQERADFEGEKKQAETLNSKAVEYEIARQEAAQSRSLYESLRGRLKEADVVAGLRSSNIALVDAAHVPAKPAKPNVLMYAAGGIAGGVLLGIMAALLRDATDHRIHDIGDAKALMGGALIGFVPHHSGLVNRSRALRLLTRTATTAGSASGVAHNTSAALIAQLEPHSAFSESLRSVRTAIEQTTLCQRPPQVILVTSSVPGEGKSSLSLNLAAIYAQGGRKVLLVDTDLRTPTLGRRLNVNETCGLSSLLLHEHGPDTATPIRIALDGRVMLDAIPAGPIPAYPTELLASDEMARLLEEWRREYDYVLLDSAPLLPVTDSALLSKLVDYTVVVARHKMTDLRSIERTSELLQSRGIYRAGVVINGIQAGSGDLYRHYGYNHSAYYGGRISA